MFRSPSKLEVEIERMLTRLRESADDVEQYDLILARLERLIKLREKPNTVSADTWALIGANIVGIVIIITHEYTNPITTKALNLAMRVKP
jgi:hypothetical protein